jgi:hypothetical protein
MKSPTNYQLAYALNNVMRIVGVLGIATEGLFVIGAVTADNVGDGALTVPIPKVSAPTHP